MTIRSRSTRSPFTLKPHQDQAVNSVIDALQSKTKALLEIGTGGGKTVISAELARRQLTQDPRSILVISKSHELVAQHVCIFDQHLASMARDRFVRLGCAQSPLRELTSLSERHVRRGSDPVIIFTTIHTLYRRLRARSSSSNTSKGSSLIKKIQLGLVLWDECHWADRQAMGNQLMKWAKSKKARLVGLSATPKPQDQSLFGPPVFVKDLKALLDDGLLAQPVITQVDTSFTWAPNLDTTQGDYAQSSLATLNHASRNAKICEHYLSKRYEYRRTIIFSVNIAHANALATLMSQKSIPVGLIHCEMSKRDQAEMIRKFRRGAIEVLINVMMLTHGIDIPEVDTLFMTRPTRSKRLYLQMIGRGVRKQGDEQETFNLVEFTDNLLQHGLSPIEWSFYRGCSTPNLMRRPRVHVPHRRLDRHAFNSRSLPERIGSTEHDFFKEYEYLWFMNGQTFGVELEFTAPRWHMFPPGSSMWNNRAQHLLNRLREALRPLSNIKLVADRPSLYHRGSHNHWSVESDASTGWEVTSRILTGYSGLVELGIACRALDQAIQEVGLKVNARTGFHLHLGWVLDLPSIKRLVLLMHHFEPLLGSIVAPSRVANYSMTSHRYDPERANSYCQPISSALNIQELMRTQSIADLRRCLSTASRGASLNLKPLFSYGTVEFRLHSGTAEIHKILLWISLCQQILQAARGSTESLDELMVGVRRREVITPTQNLDPHLLGRLPDGLNPKFLRHLKRRQSEIATRVLRISELRRSWRIDRGVS